MTKTTNIKTLLNNIRNELIKTNHLAHLDNKITHVHEDVEKLGGKIDRIYWVVVSTVGAVGLMFIETLLGML